MAKLTASYLNHIISVVVAVVTPWSFRKVLASARCGYRKVVPRSPSHRHSSSRGTTIGCHNSCLCMTVARWVLRGIPPMPLCTVTAVTAAAISRHCNRCPWLVAARRGEGRGWSEWWLVDVKQTVNDFVVCVFGGGRWAPDVTTFSWSESPVHMHLHVYMCRQCLANVFFDVTNLISMIPRFATVFNQFLRWICPAHIRTKTGPGSPLQQRDL